MNPQALEVAAEPWAASVTFSKSTESHAGTVIHGQKAREGYSFQDLLGAVNHAVEKGHDVSLADLWYSCGLSAVCDAPARAAHVLVIRQAMSLLADLSREEVQSEYLAEIWPNLDRHLVQYGEVMNKHARANAELGPHDIPSNYRDFALGEKVGGRPVTGRVIAFDRVPAHAALARGWEALLGEKGRNLLAEVNHYGPSYPHHGVKDKNPSHRFSQTGIGFHGDSERPDVACLCLGNTAKELHFQAFAGKEPVGKRYVVTLQPGDAYVMCKVGCGFGWKTELRNPAIVHYRHAAGAPDSSKWTLSTEEIKKVADQKAKRKRAAKEQVAGEGGAKRTMPR